MDTLTKRIREFTEDVTFESLHEFIRSFDFDQLHYEEHIREPDIPGDYGRNIITLTPFECVLICWPPKTESAIHHHNGLFGYVLVLEGELDNVCYRREGEELQEYLIDVYGKGGLMPEPDGVIHKLRNHHESKRAITLHFYYPALTSFEGMRIYNVEKGETAMLSAEAQSASWQEKEGHFKKVEKNAFTFRSFEDLNAHKSHFISYVIPKPDADRIDEMNAEYFGEQADEYDFSDFNQPNRKAYIHTINSLIAENLKKDNATEKLLDIATGTGRRATNIRTLSGIDYDITGVDVSMEMCRIAASRGIRTYHQPWVNDDDHIGETFDVVTFLYAFGHIANEEVRLKALRKINSYLKPGGKFYFDLFNVNNESEWGPLAVKAFEKRRLYEDGYQRGDVFYRKRGFEKIAFLHYFDIEEVHRLLKETGFEIEEVIMVGYSVRPGEILEHGKQGNYFVKAVKKA